MGKGFKDHLIDAIAKVVSDTPVVDSIANKIAINFIIGTTPCRPSPWSTAHDYVSWTSLTNQNWMSRHLPAKQLRPPIHDNLADFFKRPDKKQTLSKVSTCLFPSFAQFLTDGFIRTKMPNKSKGDSDLLRKQTTSNNQLDLSQLYGRTEDQTNALRVRSQNSGFKGKLKSQIINGEEYAPFLFDGDANNYFIKEEFDGILDRPLRLDFLLENNLYDYIKVLFAFGGDRANAAPQVAMITTLFLREHNRMAALIEAEHPDWDDDHVFEVARNNNILIYIRIIIEEYINHISTTFDFKIDPSIAWKADWNRPNWVSTEFSLLYRWHSLIPDDMVWKRIAYPVRSTLLNNNLLINGGLKQGFIDMSSQKAGKLSAFNTAAALVDLEQSAINQGRLCQLASYCDYRRHYSLDAPSKFEDISNNPVIVAFLKQAYSDVEDIEFYIGLFAEDTYDDEVLPELLGRMVAVDAFSQALTNPLLSECVWAIKEDVFTPSGLESYEQTRSLKDLLKRNVPDSLDDHDFIGMTQK